MRAMPSAPCAAQMYATHTERLEAQVLQAQRPRLELTQDLHKISSHVKGEAAAAAAHRFVPASAVALPPLTARVRRQPADLPACLPMGAALRRALVPTQALIHKLQCSKSRGGFLSKLTVSGGCVVVAAGRTSTSLRAHCRRSEPAAQDRTGRRSLLLQQPLRWPRAHLITRLCVLPCCRRRTCATCTTTSTRWLKTWTL